MIHSRAWGAGQPWTDWTERGVVSTFPGDAGLSPGRDSNLATTGKDAGSTSASQTDRLRPSAACDVRGGLGRPQRAPPGRGERERLRQPKPQERRRAGVRLGF